MCKIAFPKDKSLRIRSAGAHQREADPTGQKHATFAKAVRENETTQHHEWSFDSMIRITLLVAGLSTYFMPDAEAFLRSAQPLAQGDSVRRQTGSIRLRVRCCCQSRSTHDVRPPLPPSEAG